MPAAPAGAPHPRVLDRLLAEKKIGRDAFNATVALWRREGGWAEDLLIDSGAISEGDLLKALAAIYRVRFVSTDKLSKAVVDKSTLDLIPRKIADRNTVAPVLLDRKTATLSIVTPDPSNLTALEEVKMSSGVRDVQPLIARPAAVLALIAKIYGLDPRPFAALERKTQEMAQQSIDVYGRAIGPTVAQAVPQAIEFERGFGMFGGEGLRRDDPAAAPAQTQAQAAPDLSLPPPPMPTASLGLPTTAPAAPAPPAALPAPPAPNAFPPRTAQPTSSEVPPSPSPSLAPPPSELWLETLNVLIALLENGRTDLRGHSAHVARLTRKLCERMGLEGRDADVLVAAAHLHDLGKASSYHLTALNVAEYDGHRIAAQKSHQTPTRLTEAVRLSDVTAKAVLHMYERFDGKGLPDGLAGKDIPLGARILAITDTYADLTQNPRNPFRKALRPIEASEVLHKFRGQIFDPNLVDVFKHVVTGDDLKKKLLANRRSALLIDPDPEETTVLELRMIEQGFEVKICRNAEQALKMFGEGEFELVVSEVELPALDGFALFERARQTEGGKDAIWVFLSERASREDVNKGFELGAADYVQKPAKAEILVAKLKKLVEQGAPAKQQATRGVSGSLEEMSLPDMVQILAQGRKTGALKIRSGNELGELHFVNGEIFNANFGKLKAEEAVYGMLRLRTGDFSLDPNFKADQRVINMSAEGLLLEGMRRFDESSRVAPAR